MRCSESTFRAVVAIRASLARVEASRTLGRKHVAVLAVGVSHEAFPWRKCIVLPVYVARGLLVAPVAVATCMSIDKLAEWRAA